MKRILAILAVWLVPAMLLAQTTKTIEVRFAEKEFSYIKDGNGYYIASIPRLASYDSDTLSPALPYVVVNVLLDPNTEYKEFKYTCAETLCREDFFLNANVKFRPISEEPTIQTGKVIVYTEKTYPATQVKYAGTHLLCGYKYVSFLVSPFRYDAERKRLFLSTSFKLSVTQSASMGDAKSVIYPSGKETIQQLVVNTRDVENYGEYDGIIDYEYVIVTCDSLKPAFQKLADWKTTKGIAAKVLTTEEIYNQYTGATSQIKIKKALKDYYDGQHHGLRYVLLGGDVDIVPAQMCFIACNTTEVRDTTPTDWFYGCLDTMDWDTNGNGYAGEIGDSVDIAAELIVSRMSASTENEAEIMVERIIQYERTPNTENWWNKILMCGSKYHRITDTGISDAQKEGENLYNQYIAPYWNGERFRIYDTGTDHNLGPNYDFNIEHLQEHLAKGYTFAEIGTHGEYWGFMMEDTLANGAHYYYTTDHADTLQNRGYTTIITDACYTNGFDYSIEPSLSEAFMRNPQSGILAYIGSARQGWVCDVPYSWKLDGLIYKKLFTSLREQLGPAFYNAKLEDLGFCYSYSSPRRWLLFSVNMLGDPEMPVFLKRPLLFNDSTLYVYYDGTGIIVNVEGTNKICFMSKDDMGQSYYVSTQGDWDMDNYDGDISICITKPGYIPYMASYGDNVFLQNETIEWDHHVFSKKTTAGRNVTNLRDEGPVVLEQGKTTILSTQETSIVSDFEVKLGAELEINVGNY